MQRLKIREGLENQQHSHYEREGNMKNSQRRTKAVSHYAGTAVGTQFKQAESKIKSLVEKDKRKYKQKVDEERYE